MTPNLSFGALSCILDGIVIDNVILQVLGYKFVPGSNNNRFRLLLNDGQILFPYAILATQLNSLIENKCLEKYTIINLKKYVCSQISSQRKVIICLHIDVITQGTSISRKISDASISNSFSEADTPTQIFEVSTIRNERPVVQQSIFNNDQLNASTSSRSGGQVVQQSVFNNDQLNSSTLSALGRQSRWNSNANASKSFVPISSLTPYQNKWVIKARIIYKTASISYRNQRNEGKYFSFYLLDDSGEIRATAFNEHASKLENTIELNKIYHISNAQVKLSNGNSAIKSDFELVVDQNTKIVAFDDHCAAFPKLAFNFQQICDISSYDKDTLIDVIGICNAASDVKKIVVRSDSKELSKRDIELIDSSKTAVTISLWGIDAENFKQENHSVIAIRNGKVSDFRGHSISVSPFSMLFINPDIPETHHLKRWFSSLNENVIFQSISSDTSLMKGNQNWKTFAQIIANEQCYGDQAKYFSIKATIIMVAKEKCLYQACPAVDCFKKVQLLDGLFKCSKCNQMYSTFKWTCLLSINIADFTDSHWAIAFKEIAESFVGLSAKELHAMKENNEDKYYDVLSDLHFKTFIFNLRSKTETYNETSILKSTILSKSDVDLLLYTKKLLGDIKRFSSILNES